MLVFCRAELATAHETAFIIIIIIILMMRMILTRRRRRRWTIMTVITILMEVISYITAIALTTPCWNKTRNHDYFAPLKHEATKPVGSWTGAKLVPHYVLIIIIFWLLHRHEEGPVQVLIRTPSKCLTDIQVLHKCW